MVSCGSLPRPGLICSNGLRILGMGSFQLPYVLSAFKAACWQWTRWIWPYVLTAQAACWSWTWVPGDRSLGGFLPRPGLTCSNGLRISKPYLLAACWAWTMVPGDRNLRGSPPRPGPTDLAFKGLKACVSGLRISDLGNELFPVNVRAGSVSCQLALDMGPGRQEPSLVPSSIRTSTPTACRV